jgi:hypothetical protein
MVLFPLPWTEWEYLMSGVKVSENVPGAAVCIELLPSKVRSIFYSPANNRTLKRKYQQIGSLPDVRWNFPPQTVSRTANVNRDAMSQWKPAASLPIDFMHTALIPLKEFETCR